MALRQWSNSLPPIPPADAAETKQRAWTKWVTSMILKLIENQIAIISQIQTLTRK